MSRSELPATRAAAVVPDAVGTLVAWRAWSLGRSRDGRISLRPLFRGPEPWPAMAPAQARCRRSPKDHEVPDPECGCGLYAVPDPRLLPDRNVSVVGTVSLWGRIVEHERGFRAEFGYPESLRLVCARCGRARSLDSMCVREDPGKPGYLSSVCARHLRDRRGSARPARQIQGELLSTYGVEALPEPATRTLRWWRSEILRLLSLPRAAKAIPALAFAASLAALSFVAVSFVGLQAGAAIRTSRSAAAAVESRDRPAADVHTRPELASVCGDVLGRRIHVVSCGVSRSDLVGLAYRPGVPSSSCLPVGIFTSGRGFSVCWAEVVGSGESFPFAHELHLEHVRWPELAGG